jgi:hypothetical protein
MNLVEVIPYDEHGHTLTAMYIREWRRGIRHRLPVRLDASAEFTFTFAQRLALRLIDEDAVAASLTVLDRYMPREGGVIASVKIIRLSNR